MAFFTMMRPADAITMESASLQRGLSPGGLLGEFDLGDRDKHLGARFEIGRLGEAPAIAGIKTLT